MLIKDGGVTKEIFCDKTGFSLDQFHSWTTLTKSARVPSTDQVSTICEAFEWSPTFIFYGVGAKYMQNVISEEAAMDLALELIKSNAIKADLVLQHASKARNDAASINSEIKEIKEILNKT